MKQHRVLSEGEVSRCVWMARGLSAGRSLRVEKKVLQDGNFAKRPHVAHIFMVAVGGWRLAVGGGWQRLVVGDWWWVAVGSDWRLAVGGGWRLAIGGGWWLAVGGPWGRS